MVFRPALVLSTDAVAGALERVGAQDASSERREGAPGLTGQGVCASIRNEGASADEG